MPKLHDFTVTTIDGDERSLGDYAGQVCLLVNVASRCGLTPHYEGLQKLHQTYGGRGLAVLGFPCNQFGAQEPGTEEEIKEFCTTNYGVEFPMFSKLDVNGDGRDPLYAWLTSEDAQPEGAGDIKWNFTKFVVGKDGDIVSRFDPRVEPESAELTEVIEKELG